MAKKKYTELQALELIFSYKKGELPLTIYNRVQKYKKRFRDGELNRTAIEKLLTEFGFSRPDVLFYEKSKNIHLKK